MSIHRAGTAALIGRPNVGKSTLVNALVGTKVAIVTPKPQTTRTRIVGIRTEPEAQVVFLDTPGIHAARSSLNRRMVEIARSTIEEADAVVLVLDAGAGIGAGERELIATLRAGRTPVVVALNKIDTRPRQVLLPIMAELNQLLPGVEVVPTAARRNDGVDRLLAAVARVLPEGPPLYPADEFTTESERFLTAELVREQVFLATKEEVPYGTAVVIDQFVEREDRRAILVSATILVEREAHKPILLGAKGERLKRIGEQARAEIERLLGTKVFLELFVRVEPGWQRSRHRLGELGL